ncbi:MAG: nuclear transport factor 2 family protein [Boseongicola sp. SB0675_bin_26]|nr:nuclear transport factor 2 family protein [Boseongicola sp. SB0675_bin_26]
MIRIRRFPQRNAWRRGRVRKWLRASLMSGQVLLTLAALSHPALAEDLPEPVSCYQDSANAKDIEAYMSCFTTAAEMVDVSRTFAGKDAIRAWALREVIPSGETFRHRRILEQGTGYAKTEVNWLNWVVHYTYWWDDAGKIIRMSLQYAN